MFKRFTFLTAVGFLIMTAAVVLSAILRESAFVLVGALLLLIVWRWTW